MKVGRNSMAQFRSAMTAAPARGADQSCDVVAHARERIAAAGPSVVLALAPHTSHTST
jgi:hypothetical protein